MKYFLSVVLLSAVTLSLSAVNVTVTFTNLRTSDGVLIIGIFNDALDFPKEGSQWKKICVPVSRNEVTTSFVLPPGEYALAVCHDEDNDGTCNQNFFGIPTEGFAFSNNFRPKLTVPKFDDVKFTVVQDTNLNIKLLYF